MLYIMRKRVIGMTDKAGAYEQLTVSMLGRFELRVGDVKIDDEINRSRKMWNLLAYILMHRDKIIPQQEFIEVLWPEEDSARPGNALKTLLYRIRMLLEPLSKAYGGEELIVSQRGAYGWNREVPVQLDAERFEELCIRADAGDLSDEVRMELLRDAIGLYQGDLLPRLSFELWVVALSTHYHTLYLNAVKTLSRLLAENGRYAEMVTVLTDAIELDPLDEQLHANLVLALIRQGKDAAALAHYESATDLLYRNLGVRPSEELRALYQEIMKTQKNLELDLGVIQEHLREAEAIPGAFVCEYGFFKEAYRLEARRAARYGMAVFIGLITVSTPAGEVPELGLLNATMDLLLEVIKTSLRRGDVVSRYSGAQFVIMLPALTYEDGETVMQRIVSNFYRKHKRYLLKLHYKLQQLDLQEP